MNTMQRQIALSIAVPFAVPFVAPVTFIGVAVLGRARVARGFVGRRMPISGDLTRPPDRC